MSGGVHLIKLCVGIDSVDELARREAEQVKRIGKVEHITRATPKRRDDLLDGGSFYWIIKGHIRVRQSLLEIETFTDGQGVKRCKLELDPKLVPTYPQPRRAFQGWRYLPSDDAPRDLAGDTEIDADMPDDMRAELAALGLL